METSPSWRRQLWFGLALDEVPTQDHMAQAGQEEQSPGKQRRGLVYLALAREQELGCEQRPRVNKGFCFFLPAIGTGIYAGERVCSRTEADIYQTLVLIYRCFECFGQNLLRVIYIQNSLFT